MADKETAEGKRAPGAEKAGNGSTKDVAPGDFTPRPVPGVVRESFRATAESLGGPYTPSPEAKGAVGFTHFDGPSADDGTVTVLVDKRNMDKLPSQALVRIKSLDEHGALQRSYLGAVVQGPFADPDGIPVNSPLLEQNTVQGSQLLTRYHGRAAVQLMGEEAGDQLVPPRFRPRPNSPVHVLSEAETSAALNLGGDLSVGLAVGYESLEVSISTAEKNVLPRHLGVLGTTGGGKSQTVSAMIHGLQRSGLATILVDVEGEYTEIDQPASHAKLAKALEKRGITPAGTANVIVYHLVGRETSREAAGGTVKKFSLSLEDLSPYTVADLLEYNDAQRDRFLLAYDVTQRALRDIGVYPASPAEKKEALTIDLFDRGYPRMTVAHLLDVARTIHNVVAKSDEAVDYMHPDFKSSEAQGKLKSLVEKAKSATDSKISWLAVLKALWRINSLKVFDRVERDVGPLNFSELVLPGRVSVIDLSDTDSTVLNNLVIASLLRGAQKAQDAAVDEARKKGTKPTPVMLIIEEAHEFLSAERIKEMPSVFQQVARIAKRGRKRWFGLTFVTQLPQHLPDEVLGLINNWVLHKIGDANVIARLKRSIVGIDDAQWRHVAGLAPGQAMVSFTSMTRPLMVAIDPSPSHVRLTD